MSRARAAAYAACDNNDDDDERSSVTLSSSSLSDVEPVGAAFSPEFLLGHHLFLPSQAERIRQTWVPRIIGRVANAGSSPQAFEPGVQWRALGAPMRTSRGAALSRWSNQPYLAFIDGWGSGNDKLFGTYLATHWRHSHAITYLAVRKIVPSSDFTQTPTGLSSTMFEALERNVHWVSMAIGSIDRSGDAGDSLSLFVHINDDDGYQTLSITAHDIDTWRSAQSMLDGPPGAVDADKSLGDENARVAQRRYWQLVLAVKNAALADAAFAETVQALPVLRALFNEADAGIVPSGDPRIYMPDFSTHKR